MIEIARNEAGKLKDLFAYTEETMVLSFLQGHMGRGWVDDIDNPTCAQIIVGDFCVLAGNSEAAGATELVKNAPPEFANKVLFVVPQNDAWSALIEKHLSGRCRKILRYAIKKEKDCFDREKLQKFTESLPPEYRLAQINERIYEESLNHSFSEDWCSQFASAEDYMRRGLGFCVVRIQDDSMAEIVCGASSYTVYDEGIEIEIDTKEGYKHQGLATACAAKLILECLDRGLYPSWDAANKISVALAEKLGYHFDFEYTTYEVFADGKNLFGH